VLPLCVAFVLAQHKPAHAFNVQDCGTDSGFYQQCLHSGPDGLAVRYISLQHSLAERGLHYPRGNEMLHHQTVLIYRTVGITYQHQAHENLIPLHTTRDRPGAAK
jgi:hypothetical protein